MSFESEHPTAGQLRVIPGGPENPSLSEEGPANLPSNIAHWLNTAESDEPATPDAPSSTLLFNGDTGSLRLETRRCLVSLLNGPSVDGRRQTGLWSVLLRDREVIQTYLHNIFLDLVIDIAQQVAFIRQVPDESETDIPILLRRHQLTLVESALVLFLRQRLTEADSANERAVVSTDEMVEHLSLFDRARNTDLARFDRQCDGAIKKCKALNLIRPIRSSAVRFEVSPTLKLLFNAEDIQALTTAYEALKSAPSGAGGMTTDQAVANDIDEDDQEWP